MPDLKWREVATFVVSVVTILGFFALMFLNKIPAQEMQMVIGALIGWVGASINFYVGSSQGSTAKGGTIEKMAVEKGQ